jgi:hypothetical protein
MQTLREYDAATLALSHVQRAYLAAAGGGGKGGGGEGAGEDALDKARARFERASEAMTNVNG